MNSKRYLTATVSSSKKTNASPMHNITLQPKVSASKEQKKFIRTPKNADCTMSNQVPVKRKLLGNPIEPKVDWDLECSSAYNNFLQNLLMDHVITDDCNDKREALNDQLSIQSDYLCTLEEKKIEIENELTNLKLQSQIQSTLIILNDMADTLDSVSLGQDNFVNVISKVHQQAKEAYNSIELVNVKPITMQNQYDELITLISSCNGDLKKITSAIYNADEIKQLSECITVNNKLKEDVSYKLDILQKLEEKIVHLVLKNSSDALANNP